MFNNCWAGQRVMVAS